MKFNKFMTLILLVVSAIACEGEKMTSQKEIDVNKYKIDSEALNIMAGKTIYFAHQSVGGNIIDGIEEIVDAQAPGKIKIQKRSDAEQVAGPVFLHEYIGENEDPLLKINEYKNSIINEVGQDTDIAVMKFCYLDINKNTDINQVFNEYKKAVNEFENKYPDLKVAHVTVPLTLRDSSIRAFIKNIIGRPDNNIMRARFNELLLNEYASLESVFDLAAIESTREDGSRTEQKDGDIIYYSLVPEYAADNGHLNRLGQLNAGKQFIEFLAKYSAK